MDANINNFIDKIILDAEYKVKADLSNISAKVKNDFIKKANEVVMLYYSHYPKPPRMYDRTNNLKDNVVDDSLSFNVLNRASYGAWIQFNSNNMSEYDVGNKDVVVFNFMGGIHGKPSIFVENEPAITLMNDFQNNYKTTLDGYFVSLGYTVK